MDADAIGQRHVLVDLGGALAGVDGDLERGLIGEACLRGPARQGVGGDVLLVGEDEIVEAPEDLGAGQLEDRLGGLGGGPGGLVEAQGHVLPDDLDAVGAELRLDLVEGEALTGAVRALEVGEEDDGDGRRGASPARIAGGEEGAEVAQGARARRVARGLDGGDRAGRDGVPGRGRRRGRLRGGAGDEQQRGGQEPVHGAALRARASIQSRTASPVPRGQGRSFSGATRLISSISSFIATSPRART